MCLKLEKLHLCISSSQTGPSVRCCLLVNELARLNKFKNKQSKLFCSNPPSTSCYPIHMYLDIFKTKHFKRKKHNFMKMRSSQYT